MKRYLDKIMDKEYFSKQDASGFIHAVAQQSISNEEIAAVLIGIQIRGVALDEIEGFRTALLELALKPEINTENAIDLCGTGGDGKDTFNISTISSLVLAAMGQKVIKHGNYGVSSSCGSSNVLEQLGFKFTTDEKVLNAELETKNICFLHAPLFHPTLKGVAPIRKNLGVRTIFNALGPLVNPVQPPNQLTGTFSLELAKIYQHILRANRESYHVVYSMDGYDEISLTDDTRLLSQSHDHIFSAHSLQIQKVNPEEIKSGGTIENAAKLAKSILRGEGTNSQNKVVAANVALARKTVQPNLNFKDCFEDSLTFIESGQTAKHFNLYK